MKTMVLAEPAGSGTGGHEKSRMLRVKVFSKDQLGHVSGGQDTGITFFARGQLAAPDQGFLIRIGQDLSLHTTGLEGRGNGQGMISHGRDINPAMIPGKDTGDVPFFQGDQVGGLAVF